MAPFNYAVTPPPASPGLSPVSTSPDPCSPVHPLHFLVPSPVELSRVGSGGKEGGPCGLSPGPWGRRGGGGSGGAQPLWPRFTCLGRSPRPALGGRPPAVLRTWRRGGWSPTLTLPGRRTPLLSRAAPACSTPASHRGGRLRGPGPGSLCRRLLPGPTHWLPPPDPRRGETEARPSWAHAVWPPSPGPGRSGHWPRRPRPRAWCCGSYPQLGPADAALSTFSPIRGPVHLACLQDFIKNKANDQRAKHVTCPHRAL